MKPLHFVQDFNEFTDFVPIFLSLSSIRASPKIAQVCEIKIDCPNLLRANIKAAHVYYEHIDPSRDYSVIPSPCPYSPGGEIFL